MATRRHKNKSEETSKNKRIKMSEDSVKDIFSRKTIEKLLKYDSKIVSKIDILINGQKDIENHLKDVENKLSENNNKTNNTIDQDYIKDEYRDATEKFLKDENPEFLNKFRKNKCKLPSVNFQNVTWKIQEWKNKSEQKLENKEKFLCFKTKDKSSSTDADNSKLDKGANDNKGTNTNGKNADKGEGDNTDSKGEGINTDNKGGEGASINNKGEGIYDSNGSYNIEKEDWYLNSLFDNYKLCRR
ncbi:hypothetical protein GLOIN_2v1591384 [Rhizophagus clarus]|uniref:Uncharacterized protein n=1 Tax=Rhizophagus clarus TaxID=94130 RepID=A0A8H3MHD7_9GLOM|nr:hypothetical protein GLOIN_2v1591384 [Rhizophagus clarus]